MSDVSQGEGWWQASDGKWYEPQVAPNPAPPTPPSAGWQAPAPVPAGGIGLPPGVAPASPWIRLGSYLLEGVLVIVTLWIGWIIWASMTASTGQTPAKKLLGLRVIDSTSIQPIGFGKMFWMRGVLAPFVAQFAIFFTLGILAFMPFWDSRNQNIWDKVSGCYVVSDPNDAWGTRPNLTR